MRTNIYTMNKICTKCGIEKPIEEFYKNKTKRDGHSSICKDCQREADRRYYLSNKDKVRKRAKVFHKKVMDYINSRKSIGCYICSEKDIACLDFHHLRDKVTEVAKLIGNDNLTQIKTEIDKCVVLCANCHRKLHFYGLSLEELKQHVSVPSAA